MPTLFEGSGVLCFYTHGLLQGHFIDNATSPYSLAGKPLPDYVDPQHNDCMEPDDFYTVLIQPHSQQQTEKILLTVRRPKENDAGGLLTHEHEADQNNGYGLSFETNQFFSGEKAQILAQKYFKTKERDVIVCMGDVKLDHAD